MGCKDECLHPDNAKSTVEKIDLTAEEAAKKMIDVILSFCDQDKIDRAV